MIVLNECRIDQEGKHLIIEASVDNLPYYDNVYIDSVIVDTDKTYQEGGPSYNPVYQESYDQDYSKVISDCGTVTTDTDCKCGNIYTSNKYGRKKVRLSLDKNDLLGADLNNNIFFVYIVASGTPSPDTPCGMDNSYAMGIAVNLRPIYNMAMSYIKELNQDCTIPKGFIDMILRMKAFELSLKTGNYTMAFKYWDKFFKDKVNVPIKGGCGCNGTN